MGAVVTFIKDLEDWKNGDPENRYIKIDNGLAMEKPDRDKWRVTIVDFSGGAGQYEVERFSASIEFAAQSALAEAMGWEE